MKKRRVRVEWEGGREDSGEVGGGRKKGERREGEGKGEGGGGSMEEEG